MSFLRGVIVGLACLLMVACVTSSTSSLTEKANPELAVERYVQLALEYVKRGELSRAKKHLARALEIDPDAANANAAMALVYSQEGEYLEAERLFKAALSEAPDYTRGRSYYAAFLYAQKRYQEALAQFQEAVKNTNYDGRAQLYSNIALCHIKLGQPESAIDAYEQTLRLDKVNGRALAGISELYFQLGQYDKSQAYYNRLVRLIRDKGMKHTAQSLWLGIRLARHYGSLEQAKALESLLNELYPHSNENSLSQKQFSRVN